MRGIRSVVGCLDGTHVPGKARLDEKSSYVDRKGWTSDSPLSVTIGCGPDIVQWELLDVFTTRVCGESRRSSSGSSLLLVIVSPPNNE